jgi:hypothetical protein
VTIGVATLALLATVPAVASARLAMHGRAKFILVQSGFIDRHETKPNNWVAANCYAAYQSTVDNRWAWYAIDYRHYSWGGCVPWTHGPGDNLETLMYVNTYNYWVTDARFMRAEGCYVQPKAGAAHLPVRVGLDLFGQGYC